MSGHQVIVTSHQWSLPLQQLSSPAQFRHHHHSRVPNKGHHHLLHHQKGHRSITIIIPNITTVINRIPKGINQWISSFVIVFFTVSTINSSSTSSSSIPVIPQWVTVYHWSQYHLQSIRSQQQSSPQPSIAFLTSPTGHINTDHHFSQISN